MAEKKPKIPLTGAVRVPQQLDREIDMEASRLGLYKYEVFVLAWEAYQKAISGNESPKASKLENTGQAISSHYQPSKGVVLSSQVLDPLERTNADSADVIKIAVSRVESEWVLGLLEAARGQVAPGVAGLIQGQVGVLLDWVRGLSNERAGDTVPAPGATPDLQGGVASDQQGNTEAGSATKRIRDNLRRVRENMAPAQDRGEEPGKKKA